MEILFITLRKINKEEVERIVKRRFDKKKEYENITVNEFYRTDIDLNKYKEIYTDYRNLGHIGKYYETSNETIAEIIGEIESKVKWTDDIEIVRVWLNELRNYKELVLDFETENLALPQFNKITMVTLGYSLKESKVIVFKDKEIEREVLEWIVDEYEGKIIAHNSLFDMRLIKYYTGKLPKEIEDSMLLALAYLNHVDNEKRKVGLKHLVRFLLPDYANQKDSFELYVNSEEYENENLIYYGNNREYKKYNLPLINYCGIDQIATTYIWKKFNNYDKPKYKEIIIPTSHPKENKEGFTPRDYYENVLKPAIPVILKMLNAGQPIDIEKVKILEEKVRKHIKDMIEKIESYEIVKIFYREEDKKRINKFLKPVYEKLEYPRYQEYRDNVGLRTFVICYYNYRELGFESYLDIDYKKYKITKAEMNKYNFEIVEIIKKKDYRNEKIVEAMKQYAWYKASTSNINRNRIDKIRNPEKYIKLGFQPYNYTQLYRFWKYLGLKSEEISAETGKESFSSTVLNEILNELQGEKYEIVHSYLEISNAKNVITQYIPKYYGSSVEGILYYALSLFGTKSARLSGKAPTIKDEELKHSAGANGVTQPVNHRVYGKDIKNLFIAPKGKIMYAIDYNALETAVQGIITGDKTIAKIQNEGYDSHCLHSYYYFPDKWTELINKPFEDTLERNKELKELTKVNKIAKELRQISKSITFGLSYGAGAKKVMKYLKSTLEFAMNIYDTFHNKLYKDLTKFREEYLIPYVRRNGKIHLNWGLYLRSDDVDKDIRTLFNAASGQGYSVITQISAVEWEKKIKEDGMEEKITQNNIIHDCLYGYIDDDEEVIKYVNDNLVKIMTRDFIENQQYPLKAELDIGYSLGEMVTLKNNCDIEEIKEKRKELRK